MSSSHAAGAAAASASMAVTENGGSASTPTSTSTPAAVSPSSVAASVSAERFLAEMNDCFAKSLALVCPPIQYPPHCRFNPVQQDAADLAEIEARLEEFFLHAKEMELFFLHDPLQSASSSSSSPSMRAELEMEIHHLESELSEKNDLVDKYSDVIRGWESKFKRLASRMAPDRD